MWTDYSKPKQIDVMSKQKVQNIFIFVHILYTFCRKKCDCQIIFVQNTKRANKTTFDAKRLFFIIIYFVHNFVNEYGIFLYGL